MKTLACLKHPNLNYVHGLVTLDGKVTCPECGDAESILWLTISDEKKPHWSPVGLR